MNLPSPPPPDDQDLDRLLGSRLRRTPLTLEQRWRELRPGLAGRSAARRPFRPAWLLWPGLVAAVCGLVLVGALLRRPSPARLESRQVVSFEELIALDAALAPARPLLEAENRDALLHLPAQPRI